MRLVDIEPLFDKYDKMNEGTEFSPIHFMNDLAALPVVEPYEDCVSREEAIRVAEQGQIQGYEWQFKKLCNLPSVKPQRPKGEWVEEKGEYGVWSCSECKNLLILTKGTPMDNEYHYCPNCGAEMEGEK